MRFVRRLIYEIKMALSIVQPPNFHSAKPITPDDSNDLTDFNGDPMPMRVLCVKKGKVTVRPNGNPVSSPIQFDMAKSSFVPCIVRRVFATGTTSTELVGIF